MFHNDVQTQLSNNWKRNTNEHPLDQILTGYSNHFNTSNQMKNLQSNTKSNTHKYIIQRQKVIRSFLNKQDETEPSIRKTITLGTIPKGLSITSISSPNFLFDELNEQSPNNNNRQQIIKKELDHQSPILIRRQRPTIENLSPIQQVSDITNISGNQLSITIPPNFIFRNKPLRGFLSDRSSYKIDENISSSRIKPLNYSKTINEIIAKHNLYIPKLVHQNPSLRTHKWTPKLSEQNSNYTRTLASILRPKPQLSRQLTNRHQHQLQSERINTNLKTNYIQDLYISSRSLNNHQNEYEMNKKVPKPRFVIEEWNDLKTNHDGISDEDESINADGNSSISTCNSKVNVQQYDHRSSNQHDLFSFPNLFIDNSKSKTQYLKIKRNIPRRRTYNLALTPVAEYLDDEQTHDDLN